MIVAQAYLAREDLLHRKESVEAEMRLMEGRGGESIVQGATHLKTDFETILLSNTVVLSDSLIDNEAIVPTIAQVRNPVHAPSMKTRRHFIHHLGLGAGLFATPGAFAEALTQTPRVGFGPFYPDHLPLDTDNDLILINDGITPAVGEISYVSGRVLGPGGDPIRNAVVEIWQADMSGIYLHSGSGGDKEKQDRNFQGYGRFFTGETGEYLFRTIKPVAYTGRCPHIHFAVKMKGREKWSTELHLKDHPLNANDVVNRSVKNPALLEVEFKPVPGAAGGELAVTFDLVMGFTPEM